MAPRKKKDGRLAPCCTVTAYRRHINRGEKVDAKCQKVYDEAGHKRQRRTSDAVMGDVVQLRKEKLRVVPDPGEPDAPPAKDEPEDPDPLQDARDDLALVMVALSRALPREVAMLSRRRQELVDRIAELKSRQREVPFSERLAASRERASSRRRSRNSRA